MFHSCAALASGIFLSSVCFGVHVGTPRSPVKCYADNRRHRDACLFPLRQLGDDEDQDGDDDSNAQRRQLIPTPAETAASLRAGPLWNCLKGKTNQRASTVTADVVHQREAISSVAFCVLTPHPHFKILLYLFTIAYSLKLRCSILSIYFHMGLSPRDRTSCGTEQVYRRAKDRFVILSYYR